MPSPKDPPSQIEPLIGDIMGLLAQVSERFEPEDSEMKQWMAQNVHTPAITELLQHTTVTMLRVVDAIGKLEPVNGITISKQYNIPKGSVSKITRRLLAQKLIRTETLPDNKKEILFRLTPRGQELFRTHRALDAQMEKGFIQFLRRYNARELAFVVRLLTDLSGESFLYPRDLPRGKTTPRKASHPSQNSHK